MLSQLRNAEVPPKTEDSQMLVLALDPITTDPQVMKALREALRSSHRDSLQSAARPCEQQETHSAAVNNSYILVETTLPDTTANIYHLSLHADRFGWSRIIFADLLSGKQLLGTTREGQEKDLSFVVVETQSSPSIVRDNKYRHRSGIFAQRIAFEEVERLFKTYGDKEKCDWICPPEQVKDYPDQGAVNPNRFYYTGIPLYDPERPIFDHEISLRDRPHVSLHDTDSINQKITEQDINEDKALEATLNAPPEIANMIMDAYQVETDINEMTTAPGKFEKLLPGQVEIHVLYSMSNSELANLEEKINENLRRKYYEKERREERDRDGSDGEESASAALKLPRCRLHPWCAIHPASRLDAWALFERYSSLMFHQEHPTFAFLTPHITSNLQPDPQVGLIQRVNSISPIWTLLPAFEAYEVWRDNTVENGQETLNHDGSLYSDPPALEVGLDYGSCFYWEPPRFVSMADEMTPPIFLLTKFLSNDQLDQVLDEVEIVQGNDDAWSQGGKFYALVPWQKDNDGNLDDVWRLAWEVLRYRGLGSTDTCIFIDRQSAKDKTVMIAHVMYTWDPQPDGSEPPLADPDYGPWTGILHARKPGREAHEIWFNLNFGRLTIPDFWNESEVSIHWRPGLVPKESWRSLTI